jgi:hypothetical protein
MKVLLKCLAKCIKLITTDNLIITIHTKTIDGITWTSPLGQIWSKMPFNMQA